MFLLDSIDLRPRDPFAAVPPSPSTRPIIRGGSSESDDNKAELDDDTDRSIEVVLRRKLT